MNKILRLVCRQADFKKIVSIGFFAAFMAVFLSAGTAQAGFWDWFRANNVNKTNNNFQQSAAVSSRAKTYTLKVSKSGYGGSYRKVTSDDRKINCGSDCSERYTEEKTVTLTAISNSNNYHFDSWRGGGCGGSGSCVVKVNKPNGTVSVTAVFKKGPSSGGDTPVSATLSVPSNFTATTGACGSGSINLSWNKVSGANQYTLKKTDMSNIDRTVSVGDVSSYTDSSVLNENVKFKYSVATCNGTDCSVYSNSVSVNSPSKCGSSSSSSSTKSSSSSVSSSVQQHTLKVKISGAGQISGGGIKCKKSIEGKYSEGGNWTCNIKVNKTSPATQITLTTETPSTQYEFGTWGDACRAAQRATSCTVTMTGNKTVSATFNKKAGSGENTAVVSVRKTGNGSGKVISIKPTGGSMAGINCGNDCSENFKQYCDFEAEGNRRCGQVYFKATADKGSVFGGWGGDCLTFKNEKDQCYVILDGAKTINANFNEGSEGSNDTTGKYNDLSVVVSEGGVVKSTDNKINCGSGNTSCKHSYKKNGTVTLKATPNSGYVVGDYSSCSKGGNVQKGVLTCKVKMTKDQNVKINFKASGTTSSSSSSSSSSFSFSTNLKVITSSATDVTSNSATLNGTVNPRGENVVYRFYYVQKGAPGTQKTTSWTSVASGTSDVSATADISGLSSGTAYNFGIHAYSYTSKKFTKVGGVKSFTTLGGSSSSSQTTSSTYKLKITVSGIGKVEDNYSKISCNSNMACEATYSKGQVITLKTEDSDSEGVSFGTKVDSWSGGGCSGAGNACFVTMDGDKEITVKFVSK